MTAEDKGKKTILIVDDYEGARQAMGALFSDHCSVLLAGNADESIKLLKENKVDLAILDYFLPGKKDGLDLLKDIRREYPDIATVMVTGEGCEWVAARALEIGCRRYFRKLFDVFEFQNEINNILGIEQEFPPEKKEKYNEDKIKANKIVEYIKQNYSRSLSYRSIAGKFDIEISQLKELFRVFLNTCPKEFINTYRIRTAKINLATTGDSIDNISQAVGFKSGRTFFTLFKKYVKMTPREYRASQKINYNAFHSQNH